MRFTAVKSAEQQSVLMLHRTRELLVRQRTMLVNALRGHCGEFGIVAAQGLSRAGELFLGASRHHFSAPGRPYAVTGNWSFPAVLSMRRRRNVSRPHHLSQ
jgi:transposase